MFTISLGHLMRRGVSLQPYEALAIAQELIARGEGVLSLDNVLLSSDGSASCITATGTPEVTNVAALLQEILPSGPRQVPGPLRYAVARGLSAVEGPPFESLQAFSASLARFEAGDRHGTIRALLQRVVRTAPAAAPQPLSIPPRLATATPVPAPLPAASRVGLAEAPLEMSAVVAVPPRAPRHFRAWPAALVAIAASFLIGMMAIGPALRRDTAPQPDRSASDVTPSPALPVGTAGTAGPTTERDAATPAGPRHETDSLLKAASHAGFSPAFAANGTVMFFHTGGRDDASSAIAVARSADSPARDPRIVTVVADGARNYHPHPSPDGRQIAFDSDRDGQRGVYLANADGTEVRRVSGPGYAAAPSWSPDGKRLAYIRAETGNPQVWNLWVQSIEEQTATRVTSYSYGQTWTASWFPDNRRICYSHEDNVIVRDLVTGTVRRFRSPIPGRLVRTPAVSPDGSTVVFQVLRDGAWLLDLASGSTRNILQDPTAEEFAWAPDGRRIAFHTRRGGEWAIHFMARS